VFLNRKRMMQTSRLQVSRVKPFHHLLRQGKFKETTCQK
jgi:hypothetical protein